MSDISNVRSKDKCIIQNDTDTFNLRGDRYGDRMSFGECGPRANAENLTLISIEFEKADWPPVADSM